MLSPHGCIVSYNSLGIILARTLGNIGDVRAVPVLREAVMQGDKAVREQAYYALYLLKDIALAELSDIVQSKKDSEVDFANLMIEIAGTLKFSEPKSAIEILDRAIQLFPENKRTIISAHWMKIRIFEVLGEYEKAIQECDEILKISVSDESKIEAEKKKKEFQIKINN